MQQGSKSGTSDQEGWHVCGWTYCFLKKLVSLIHLSILPPWQLQAESFKWGWLKTHMHTHVSVHRFLNCSLAYHPQCMEGSTKANALTVKSSCSIFLQRNKIALCFLSLCFKWESSAYHLDTFLVFSFYLNAKTILAAKWCIVLRTKI